MARVSVNIQDRIVDVELTSKTVVIPVVVVPVLEPKPDPEPDKKKS